MYRLFMTDKILFTLIILYTILGIALHRLKPFIIMRKHDCQGHQNSLPDRVQL